MVTGFDLLSHDGRLRKHWQKRAIAFIIDAVSIFLPLMIIFWIAGIDDIMLVGILSSLLFFLISFMEEVSMKATAGKMALGLRVRTIKPGLFSIKVLVRNMNRLLWFVLPLLDFALGMASRGDPRQRMLDRLAGTTVIVIAETDWHEGHISQLGELEETEEEEPIPDTEAPATVVKGKESCHECSGSLIQLADENYQCQKCGLIQ
jgi:uncharacterized RDD family membrane protein YckC